MNKTILVLINGLGIEHKDSDNIYSKKVMPAFDKAVNKELFTSLEASSYDYASGLQIFNTGTTDLLSTSFFDKITNDESWANNARFNELSTALSQADVKKLHIFFSLNSNNSFDHLKSFIKFLKPTKPIVIHLCLNGQSLDDYKLVDKTLTRFNYESLQTAKLGTIFGLNLLVDEKLNREYNDLWTMLVKGIGEQWKEPQKKFDFFKKDEIAPQNAKAIYVNDNFKIEDNDLILFFNYDKENFDKLINNIQTPIVSYNVSIELKNIKYYSLLPFSKTNLVSTLYATLTSDTSLSKAMQQLSAKTLFLIDKQHLDISRFMNNGLSYNDSPDIDYMLSDNDILFNSNQLQNILSASKYQLVVLNYYIDTCQDEATLKDLMKKIDDSLDYIINYAKEQKNSLVISSLYGMQSKIKGESKPEVYANFKGKVPVVIIDPNLNLKSIKVKAYEKLDILMGTTLKIMKPDLKVNSVIKNKSFIQKILYK